MKSTTRTKRGQNLSILYFLSTYILHRINSLCFDMNAVWVLSCYTPFILENKISSYTNYFVVYLNPFKVLKCVSNDITL